ncbi:rhodanese-like domain-containing protein [Paludibacterium denitrificans]|uniref:Sulfurtransferase n=1 Tax=Paludibacterium denitrificans TaxID=2675226 RepID=A0A844GDX0_9NEIS|nr:rhodanese-like domain-containing protein [Paludibacterium denitrificans]MTD33117.1 sulfurtransferase [Paludibacterium denitrificans]HJV06109.1 rhodanese-like domain-containing protein [Chromobacteriaceae bacterium]
MVREITASDLAAWLADATLEPPYLLDVREDWEVALAKIPGSEHIPMHLVPLRQSELPDDQPLVIICHHGVRSYQVGIYLSDVGFADVISLRGGVEAWANEVDTSMAHY